MVKKIVYFLLACDEKQTVCFLRRYRAQLIFKENKEIPRKFIKKSQSFFKKNFKPLSSVKKDRLSYWKYFCTGHNYEEVLSVILLGILQYPKEKVFWLLKIQPETLLYRFERGLLALGEELETLEDKEFFNNFSKNTKSEAFHKKIWTDKKRENFDKFVEKKNEETGGKKQIKKFFRKSASAVFEQQLTLKEWEEKNNSGGEIGVVLHKVFKKAEKLNDNWEEDKKQKIALAYCFWLGTKPLPAALDEIVLRKGGKIKYFWWACFGLMVLAFVMWLVFWILSDSSPVILYPS